MALFNKYTYSSLVDEEDHKEDPKVRRSQFKAKNVTYLFLLFIACFGFGAIGFFAAEKAVEMMKSRPILDLEMIPHTFRYNRSFSEAPSNHSKKSWRQIFPEEGGFFVHPVIAPARATFSVYHQLHCLDNMRKAYWANHDAAIDGRKLTDEDVHVDIQPSHVRHCIDLIRQSLMCHGDTTLEVVDESINGVHGFRTEHQCVNWEQLVKWTSEQQRRQHVEQIV